MVVVRTAIAADAPGIREIYAPHVLADAITFETQIPSEQEFESRIAKCLQKFPWLVCIIENEIAGYVYASPHRDREAYQWTCECSVYVSDKHQGKGIAKNLYAVLFRLLKMQGLVNLYAGITLPNKGSVSLHEHCGFVKFAEYESIGYKLGTWHKVGWWKFLLNENDSTPSSPLPYSELNSSVLLQYFSEAAAAIKMKMVNGR